MFHQVLSLVHYMHSAGLVLRYLNPSQYVCVSACHCVCTLACCHG